MANFRDPGQYLCDEAAYSARDVARILTLWQDAQGARRPPTASEVIGILECLDIERATRMEREGEILRNCRERRINGRNHVRPDVAEAVAQGGGASE